MSKIVVMKLLSGDDIVANVVDAGTNESVIEIRDVIALHQVPMEQGGIGLAVHPFLPYVTEGHVFSIALSHVIVMAPPSEDILKQYNNVYKEKEKELINRKEYKH